MTEIEKAIGAFKMLLALMLFDPLTGESDEVWQLNEHNQELYHAAELAIVALREKAEREDPKPLTLAEQKAWAATEERRMLKGVCGALSCLLKGIDGRMVYEIVLPEARNVLKEYYDKYPPAKGVLDSGTQDKGGA